MEPPERHLRKRIVAVRDDDVSCRHDGGAEWGHEQGGL